MQVTRAAGYGKSGRVSNVMSNRKLRRRQHLLRLQPSNLAVIERSRSVRWRIAADQLFRGRTCTRTRCCLSNLEMRVGKLPFDMRITLACRSVQAIAMP